MTLTYTSYTTLNVDLPTVNIIWQKQKQKSMFGNYSKLYYIV